MRLRWNALFFLFLMSGGYGYANESIPVIDSQATSQTKAHGTAVSGGTSAPANSSAYLINLVDELRNEVMVLRGQVEEQAYKLKQLKQDNRERYLELDERLRASGNAPEQPASSAPPNTALGANEQTPAISSTSTEPNSSAERESSAYQAAYHLIQQQRFDEAFAALSKMMKDYPGGEYSDNAQYWISEILMAQGKYAEAKEGFLAIIKNYPTSSKVPDATYKLGCVYDVMGNQAEARVYFEKVIAQYPDSSAARLSDTYLRNLPTS